MRPLSFACLAPTILIFALINPLGWLLYSLGLVKRGLKIALVFAPTIIAGYVMGLPYGPKGVAFAYSAVLTLWVIPFIAWCVHGTVISFRDILMTVSRPLASGIVAGGLAFGVRLMCGQVVVSFTPTCAGKQRPFRYVPRDALVCRRTEILLPGSP